MTAKPPSIDPELLRQAELAREIYEQRRQAAANDATPLSKKVRYPRVSRNRWLEAEQPTRYIVDTKGMRQTALDDDRAHWLGWQAKIDEFCSNINELRDIARGKIQLDVRYLPPFGRPRLTVRDKTGKLLKDPGRETLLALGVRGAAMPLKRAFRLVEDLHQHEKTLRQAFDLLPKLHDQLLDITYRRVRKGGGPLGICDPIAKQIKDLGISDADFGDSGHWCPLPYNSFEHLRTHIGLTSSVLTSHLMTMNQLYNTTQVTSGEVYRRVGSFHLTNITPTALQLSRMAWMRCVYNKKAQKYRFYDIVIRTKYLSRSGQKEYLPFEFPVQKDSGELSAKAVAFACLSPMWDLYRWVDFRRSELQKVIDSAAETFHFLAKLDADRAVFVYQWPQTMRKVPPSGLHICTPKVATMVA